VENPLPGGRITETFNPPTESGVDLAAPQRTPPYAAVGGAVRFAGPASGYGNSTLIRSEIDGRRVDFVYGHDGSMESPPVTASPRHVARRSRRP
jgi:murein DD-endopeptidase MepM/ murein hydrolase activator NlpD